tara:strand:+ start:36840 stop:37091 length:252 start_codon:yes stop_codon:yes gene_type:complete
MDPISLMIVISIGNVVAWLAAIYTKNGTPALLRNVITCSAGAIIVSYLASYLIPDFQAIWLLLSAFAGAVAALFIRRRPSPAP